MKDISKNFNASADHGNSYLDRTVQLDKLSEKVRGTLGIKGSQT